MRTLILSKAKLLAKSENKNFQSIFLKRDATPLDRAEMQRNRENRKRKEGEPQKEPLGATECRELTGTNGDESVWCEATLMENDKLLIGCIYRSPNSNVTNDAKINDTLKKANNLGFSHVLIFSDLNHPSLN